jgi:DNA-binding XRE family transcriptional regulator
LPYGPLTSGQYLAQARREAGLSQEQLAMRVGVAPLTIAHIETHMITPTMIGLQIARHLDIPATQLLADSAGVRRTS